jgi:hypothetical protein
MRIMVREVEKDIKVLLAEGEEVVYVANQSRIKPGGSLTTPNSIYITNRRVIFRNPRLLGLKTHYEDVDFRDISNIRMNKGFFSTDIYLKSRFLSDEVKLPAVAKKDAEQISIMIRKGTHGDFLGQLINEQRNTPSREQTQQDDPLAQLEKLGKLKDAGILTEEEFQTKKKELLAKF